MSTETATLPPVYAMNTIELFSVTDSKLLHVSLYTGRAEISRKFNFGVKTGQNVLHISGLPNVIQEDSLRVEGHGNATIHDVTLSTTPPQPVATTSPLLRELIEKKNFVRSAISRCKVSSRTLESYMKSLTVRDVQLSELGTFLENYGTHGRKFDEELAKLRKEEDVLYEEINAEKTRIAEEGSSGTPFLGMQASIGIFASNEEEIELIFTYAVSSANWEAVYDIRVDMQSKEQPMKLVYKAAITQNTGETWNDVPLTLETATPSYGVQVPELKPLKLSARTRRLNTFSPTTIVPVPQRGMPVPVPVPVTMSMSRSRSRSPRYDRGRSFRRSHSPASSRSRSRTGSRSRSPTRTQYFPQEFIPQAPIPHRQLHVTSKGTFNSSFQVPGLISIPSDGKAHNVTIAELQLDAQLVWFAVPRINPKVHLKARIKNTSDYALIGGKGSVYVDGTFIAKTDVPAVNAQETFDLSLGLDPSIHITYHPLSEKASRSGFYTKTATTLYSQRITIRNTKTATIHALKILDRIPVSEDSQINVKLISPALSSPVTETKAGSSASGAAAGGTNAAAGDEKLDDRDTNSVASKDRGKRFSLSLSKSFSPTLSSLSVRSNRKGKNVCAVSMGKEVVAQWNGADEDNVDETSLGRDGRINWICEIPPQGTVNLMIEWEVSAPVDVEIDRREY